jgi:histidine triad (HIT) family protein
MRGEMQERRFARERSTVPQPIQPASTMADKTLFSRIIDGEIPGSFVYQDEHVVAIRDINPAAPVHVLVIPRKPVPSLAELEEGDLELAGRILLAVRKVAEQEGLDRGYRVVVNTGEEGGQTVPHLHFHILGGRQLSGHGTA